MHFLALLSLLVTALLVGRGLTGDPVSAFGGMFVRDTLADVLKIAMCVTAGLALSYARPYLTERGLLAGEFYAIVLFALLGMMVMVSAGNMVTLYLGLEMLALSSYGLVAMDRDSKIASEAAMKYFVLGALASGLLLYGMSMIYGATGALGLEAIHQAAASSSDRSLLLFGVVFVLVGVSFKFGAAPFHMWVPDVYQGAPTAITLFIGSVPKIAAFGFAYRLLESGLGATSAEWSQMVAWLALLSLVIGNLLALAQTNLKRMLAYSTISHVGFLFMALANAGPTGYSAAMFYAISYAISAAAAFGAIILMSRQGFESESIADYRGLWQKSPFHATLILIVMASLAGLPPLLGFWPKFAVFQAAVAAGLVPLAPLLQPLALAAAANLVLVMVAVWERARSVREIRSRRSAKLPTA
ncbi:MAG: NADH-quinone oxidoreductase subunit N [Aquincola sp.]|nr:NADH-quinone oxidoreductase subunit N [Aquincola sp.]